MHEPYHFFHPIIIIISQHAESEGENALPYFVVLHKFCMVRKYAEKRTPPICPTYIHGLSDWSSSSVDKLDSRGSRAWPAVLWIINPPTGKQAGTVSSGREGEYLSSQPATHSSNSTDSSEDCCSLIIYRPLQPWPALRLSKACSSSPAYGACAFVTFSTPSSRTACQEKHMRQAERL